MVDEDKMVKVFKSNYAKCVELSKDAKYAEHCRQRMDELAIVYSQLFDITITEARQALEDS